MEAFGLDTGKLKNVDIGVPFLQLSLACQGLGISFKPEVLARADLASGDLCRVPIASPFSVTYYAVTPIDPVRRQAQAFIDWLKGTLEKHE